MIETREGMTTPNTPAHHHLSTDEQITTSCTSKNQSPNTAVSNVANSAGRPTNDAAARKHQDSRNINNNTNNRDSDAGNDDTDDDADDDDDDDWRQDDSTRPRASNKHTPTMSTKSHGISPKAFYGHTKRDRSQKATPRHVPDVLKDLPQRIEANVLIEQKRQHLARLSCQRSVFRDLTDLKVWPTQSMALDHLEELVTGNTDANAHNHPDSPCSGMSSSSNDFELDNDASHKRSMMQAGASPASHNERQRYRRQFLALQQQEEELQQKHQLHRTQRQDDDKDGDADTRADDVNDGTVTKSDQGPMEPLWSMIPRVFSIEKANGKRKYITGHFGRMMDHYWRKTYNKHLYELIHENTPCRLYFDLEYSKPHNPGIDDERLLLEFRDELFRELEQHLQLKVEPRDVLIDLDSSSDKKMSRHWILDLPKLFPDAIAVGRFVKRFIGRLADGVATETLESNYLGKHLFVETKNKPTCFVDLGVYTRNRLFRVLGSSKFGKDAVLRVSKTNEYPGIDIMSSQTKAEGTVMSMQDFVATNDWRPYAKALERTLVIPLYHTKKVELYDVPHDDAQGEENIRKFMGTHPQPRQASKQHVFNIRNTVNTPIPRLDRYVLDVLACRGGTRGSIRAWSLQEDHDNSKKTVGIMYQISRNRYCEMVGREHRSNNIYWTIDFKTWSCVQGCHDRECVGRGVPLSIPQDALTQIQQEYEAWQEEEFEKALLALNLDDYPSPQTNALSDLSDDALLEAMEANPELFP